MKWPWSKPPATPPQPPMVEAKPKPKEEPGIVVEELDGTDVDIRELQSRTGMQRVFDRVTGKFK